MSEVIIDNIKFKNVPDKRYGTKVNDILTQSNIGISADVAEYIQSQDFYALVNGLDIDWNGIEVEDELVLNTTADLINWIKTNGGSSAVEQIQSDWNQNDSSKKDFIKNKPTIPTPIAAINSTTDLKKKLYNARKAFFEAIVRKNPSLNKWLKGWMNRLNSVYNL